MMRKLVSFLLIVVSSNFAYSQNKIVFDAELRPRIVFDNGYKSPQLIKNSTLINISQRTRINVGYRRERLKIYISAQDVRFWGDDNIYKKSGQFGNSESIIIHQSWLDFDISTKISLELGRQIFKYDDQRILSSRSWNDFQVTYDAALLKFSDSINRLDIAVSWNSEKYDSNILPAEKFKVFDFIRYQRNYRDLNFSIIGLLTGNIINDTTEKIYLRGTYGVNFNFDKKGFTFRSSLYYQNNLNNCYEKVNAYCFSLFAKKELFYGKFNIGVGLDYLSGNKQLKSGSNTRNVNHCFDILYGKRHGFYGYMDYFSTTPEQGLQDFMIKTECEIFPKVVCNLDFHYFLLSENISYYKNSTEKRAKNLGEEFDFTLKYRYSNELLFQAGYSFYFLTDALKEIKELENCNLKFPQFFFFMIVVKPILFIN